jgi:hypothetical protein
VIGVVACTLLFLITIVLGDLSLEQLAVGVLLRCDQYPGLILEKNCQYACPS